MWRMGPAAAMAVVALAALWTVPGGRSPPATRVALPVPTVAPSPPRADRAAPSPAPKLEFWFAVPHDDSDYLGAPTGRPEVYLVASPGGVYQLTAIQAARNGRCADALDAVTSALDVSIDYASLLRPAWACFHNHHVRRIDVLGTTDLDTFRSRLVDFEGPSTNRALMEAQLPEGTDLDDVPVWARPPTGGIEYQLQAWMRSDRLDPILADLVGEARVTGALAHNVHLELIAAVALAQVEAPSEDVVAMWARRVYWAARGLSNHRLIRLLDRHRPGDREAFEALYGQATTPVHGRSPPPEVQLAMQLGRLR